VYGYLSRLGALAEGRGGGGGGAAAGDDDDVGSVAGVFALLRFKLCLLPSFSFAASWGAC
jgi:hypothetical protein